MTFRATRRSFLLLITYDVSQVFAGSHCPSCPNPTKREGQCRQCSSSRMRPVRVLAKFRAATRNQAGSGPLAGLRRCRQRPGGDPGTAPIVMQSTSFRAPPVMNLAEC